MEASRQFSKITSPVALASYRLTFGASFCAALVNAVFGLIVAITGCMRGMQCGNSSASVGLATTSAVVSGITCMVVADAVFAVIFNTLKM